MTYTTGIPSASQSLGETQNAIKDNWEVLRQTIIANHLGPNQADRGKHTFINMRNQGSAPTGQTGFFTIYSDNTTELYMRRGTATAIQLTDTAGDPVVNANGRTFLPGGLILIWGQNTVTGSGTFSYQGSGFPTAALQNFISFQTVTSLQNKTIGIAGLSNTQFTVTCSTLVAETFKYWAIGH